MQDDFTSDLLQWSSTTGDYLFTHCGYSGNPSFTMQGKGMVRFFNYIRYITDSQPDRRLSAGLSMTTFTGRGNMYVISGPALYHNFVISQTNPHPTCVCPNALASAEPGFGPLTGGVEQPPGIAGYPLAPQTGAQDGILHAPHPSLLDRLLALLPWARPTIPYPAPYRGLGWS
jgi:hypothetical protein